MSTNNANNNNYPTHLKIAKIISILHITIGLIFWRWSISLWVRGTYDSGIVLFLFPITTGALGVRIVYQLRHKNDNHRTDSDDQEVSVEQVQTNDRKKCCIAQRKPPVKCWFVLLVLTHLLTTAVYAAAAVIGISRGYQIYCIIAAICWPVSGVMIGVWSCRHRDKFQEVENQQLNNVMVEEE